jgi:hypothetical protein
MFSQTNCGAFEKMECPPQLQIAGSKMYENSFYSFQVLKPERLSNLEILNFS